jgi:hypothetical protein
LYSYHLSMFDITSKCYHAYIISQVLKFF